AGAFDVEHKERADRRIEPRDRIEAGIEISARRGFAAAELARECDVRLRLKFGRHGLLECGDYNEAFYSSSIFFVGFSTLRAGVSGVRPPRRRAKVSLPLFSHSPATARRANSSHALSQSPSR